MNRAGVLSLLVAINAVGGCGHHDSRSTTGPVLDLSAVANMEYRLPEAAGGLPIGAPVKVRNGKWATGDADGRQSLEVVDMDARGDLDGDGRVDAVVLLAYWGGGSGIFYYLAAVLNEQDHARHIASVALEDRVQVNSLRVAGGRVVVHMVMHRFSDPFCCPTLPVTKVYVLRSNVLVESDR